MDESHSDALARTLGTGDTRRRLLGALVALPVVGGLLAVLDADDTDAKDRRRRRKQRHQRRKNPGSRKRRPTRKRKGCVPATCTSLNACNREVADGCGGTLTCGACGTSALPSCHNGICVTCADACPESCGACANLVDGSTTCTGGTGSACVLPCTADADCPMTHPTCMRSYTFRSNNITVDVVSSCGESAPGLCTAFTPC